MQGATIQFVHSPFQLKLPNNPTFSDADFGWVAQEVNTLFLKGVISRSEHEPGEFISPIFLVDKKDGGKRLILNLRQLNEHIEYHHFKMHGIAHILQLVTKNCFMAVIDIKDAYYSVPIDPAFQNFLSLFGMVSSFNFVCSPMGYHQPLGSSPSS